MRMIQANCRIQFTAEDISFISDVLGGRYNQGFVVDLLSDAEARDLILDDVALYRALLERGGCLKVSAHFYFYVLVRHVLLQAGVDDRAMTDYVAEVLAEFSGTEHINAFVPGRDEPLEYCVDMMEALQSADDSTRFMLRAHLGNHSLFFAGVFPSRIRSRAERKGAPNLEYYERLGQLNYRVASDHRLARHYDLAPIYASLSDQFHITRKALNDLADRVLFIDEDQGPNSSN